MEAIAELSGITKRYGQRCAVDSVSLTLRRGERVALLGHNGAGKTTLMKLMLGLTRPSDGTVRVLGADPAGTEAAKTRSAIGFLPENIAFDDALTGLELLTFYARLKRRSPGECVELLERVGLTAAARQRVRTYSKGMRQRLGLAQALLGEPRLLLLDEPTTGLDPLLRLGFYGILRDLSAAGTTVLLSSHALTELEERTDRIAIMKGGRLVSVGGLSELRAGAGLPVRFRLRAASQQQDHIITRFAARGARADASGQVIFFCALNEKLETLNEITRLGASVEDVDIDPPTLDEVYAHFAGSAS